MTVFRIQLSIPVLVAALMFPQHPCGAQSSSSCPVQIRHTTWKAANSGFSPYKVKGVALNLQYMNVTGEEIKEVVFIAASSYREHGAMGQSMVNDSNRAPIASTSPPGKWKKAKIDVGSSEPGRTRLRVAEVTFSNGRHWVNSTPGECEWSIAP
jgi:hypothetical protein